MRKNDTAGPRTRANFSLAPFFEPVMLTPRFARRLRIRAQRNGHTATREASLLLAVALVPDRGRRRRLARLDLEGALGDCEEAS